MNNEKDKLFIEMESSKGFESGSGSTAEEIDAAQTALGVEFPWEYRAFLAQYSYASWFGHFVTGITDHGTYGVVSHTQYERDEGRCPKSAIVLDTDSLMFCRDPDDILITRPPDKFRDFRGWLRSKLSG